jgi:hypothetical protein
MMHEVGCGSGQHRGHVGTYIFRSTSDLYSSQMQGFDAKMLAK